MNIKRFVGGNLESNGYIIYNHQGGPSYIIDPGYNPKKYINFIIEKELHLDGIILTHHHYDHVGGVDVIKNTFNCPVFMHFADADQYKKNVDVLLSHGDIIPFDGEDLVVLHTPGHTKGSICIFSEKSKVVFTGDTIFDTDLGRTDLSDGSEDLMKKSVIEIIDKWDNDITIYPGHDQGCTMKCVRRNNFEFLTLRNGHERE